MKYISFSELENFAIDEDMVAEMGTEILKFSTDTPLYLVRKMITASGLKYNVAKVIVVEDKGGYKLWSGKYYDLESTDKFFTNGIYAAAYADAMNDLEASMKPSEIWNIVLQKWDRYGREVDHSITSFSSKDDAIAKYKEWLKWDETDPNFKVYKESGCFDHYYFCGDEKHRCFIQKSYLYV